MSPLLGDSAEAEKDLGPMTEREEFDFQQ